MARPMRGGMPCIGDRAVSEIKNFPSRLKSLTAGAGSYTLEFTRYEPAPAALQHKLVSRYQRKEEED